MQTSWMVETGGECKINPPNTVSQQCKVLRLKANQMENKKRNKTGNPNTQKYK